MFTKEFFTPSLISLPCFVLCLILCVHATSWEDQSGPVVGHLVKRNERKSLISTEFGRVSGAKVSDGNETFLLHFITMEPNSLFLPVMLHQDMVFYVHTGSGRLSYKDDSDKMDTSSLRRGDVFRLESGAVFFIQSDLDSERQKLRIYAIFGDAGEDLREEAAYGPYSSIRDLILGFDKRVLQETFKVPEEVIEEILSGPKPEAITHGLPTTKKAKMEHEFIRSLLGSTSGFSIFDTSNKDKKKSNLFNIFHEKPDFENCNGWSTTVSKKKYSLLKHSKYGLFMVNLTHGGMMGPHWNPKATEIAIVLGGRGMVRIVCPSIVKERGCKNARFAVEEGDVFVVPRFHPMAQLAFNNETFVFMGFSTSVKNNHPQYLAGKASVLRTLDKHISATSLGVNDTTFDRLVNQQGESVILECVSCAEEEYRIMSEEIEREREEARQREEEEARKREEEERRQEEEARKREEEEAKRREEEAARKREEEERRKREQEEEEAAARRKREEEEEKQKQQQEEERRRREQEEREARQREEEAAKRREEEEREKQPPEAEQRRREQEERESRQREEAEREKREKQQQEEEAQRMREQEEREARQRGEEEAQRRREQQAREAAAARMAEKEREAARQEEEEAQRRQQEEAGQGGGGGEQEEGRGEQPPEAQREEEAARQQEEETRQREEQGGGTGWGRRILKRTS